MTSYTRAIDAQRTNVVPAWRQAMAVPDRLYNVSAGLPTTANASFTWPNQHLGWPLAYGYSSNTNYARDQTDNYCSGTILHDATGAFGSMVFGTGGHTRVQTQLLRCRLSEDAPTWDWAQQAVYETADVNGADHYWNPTEAAALPANRKILVGDNWSAWDKQFPMAFADGWIFPRKIKTGQVGANVLHGYRFNCVAYVPPSMTGFGAGGLVVTNHSPQGPFSQGYLPSGLPKGDLIDAEALSALNSGKLDAFAVRNNATGAYTRVPGYAPDIQVYGEFISPTLIVSSRTRRVYVLFIQAGSSYGFYYLDMKNGAASATFSGWTPLVGSDGVAYPSAYAMAAFTEGYSRDLLYAVSTTDPTKLVMMDLEAGTATRLALTNSQAMGQNATLMYDRNKHRLLHVSYDSGAGLFRVTKVAIPADPTNASGYVVTTQTVPVDPSVTFTAPTITDWFGRISYHPRLDCVLIARYDSRLAGFVPS